MSKKIESTFHRWVSGGVAFGLFLLLCFGVAAMGGWITAPAIESWYRDLNKPSWNPPDWVFGPVWTILYFLMAVSIWTLWLRRREHSFGFSFALFGVQLIFNLSWSFLFFGLQSPWIALWNIVLLWASIGAYILYASRISRFAAFLFAPYWIWVTFAALLNYTIWEMNRFS